MVRRALQLLLALVIFAGALAGCTSATTGSGTRAADGSGPSGPSSSTTSAPPQGSSTTASATSPSGGAGTTVSGPTTATSTPLCLSDIRVIPGTAQGAAGHIALVLVFNNVSRTTTCEIIGYPGVDLVTSSGATVAHLTRTLRGMAGGEPAGVTAPRPVILRPGQSASALAEASDVPQGGISDCGNYSLLITVPNQTVSVPGGTATLPRCDAQIHPVVPGTAGGMG